MSPRESITSAAIENLDLSIADLADQLQVLREVLDEIREDVSWATRNERLVALPILYDPHGIPLAAASPPEATLVFQLGPVPKLGTITGVDAVVQTVSDVADQVATATIGLAWVRDEVKQALNSAESEPSEPPAESIPLSTFGKLISNYRNWKRLPSGPHTKISSGLSMVLPCETCN